MGDAPRQHCWYAGGGYTYTKRAASDDATSRSAVPVTADRKAELSPPPLPSTTSALVSQTC